MPIQAPQWTDFLSCPICYNEFECSARRPISLGCGHTMCKSCLSKLQRKQCPFDQTAISTDINQLPENCALLQLVGEKVSEGQQVVALVAKEDYKNYQEAKKCIEELALYLKSTSNGSATAAYPQNSLSRPMQRKLVTLINCQLVEEEGRNRAMRTARSIGERSVTELILQHQNPQQLSANLWAAVRARGCQFLGPAMQEEVLKLVLLALEDGSALSRKVLVMFVVQRLAPHFPQASKTSIGHVVQLLYRASCFKVSKHEGDSSLMQLKEEFRTYETLRREHDSQITQIATEAGLRIAPEQWSSLLYGDTTHKSHMQSIIDKLQTPGSFSQSVQELVIALQRTGDPGNLSILRSYMELLAGIDPSPDSSAPFWEELKNALEGARIVVKGLVDFLHNFGNRKVPEDRLNLNAKYKTSMCRDLAQRRNCPRGLNCTFAHSQEELEKFRAKSKTGSGSRSNSLSSKSIVADSPQYRTKEAAIPISPATLNVITSHTVSDPIMTSPGYVLPNFGYDGAFIDAHKAKSPNAYICSTQINDPCIVQSPTMIPESHRALNSPYMLNPDTPAFQPLIAKPSQVINVRAPHQILPTNKLCPENYTRPLSPAVFGFIPTPLGEMSPTKLKLGSKCISVQPVINATPCHITHEPQAFSYIVTAANVVNADALIAPMTQLAAVKNPQYLESQTLASLHHRKNELLAQLESSKNIKFPSIATDENCRFLKTISSDAIHYSPWTSTSIFSQSAAQQNCNSDSYSMNSSCSNLDSPNSTGEPDPPEANFSKCALFWPSEKDEFIPFDPPLVSKYGPISRCSKSMIRSPAPIQVNAFSQMGEMTSSTSVNRHPLPSASEFYSANSPTFAIPVHIVPERELSCFAPVEAVILPETVNRPEIPRMDVTICPKSPQRRPDELQHLVQSKVLDALSLREELWEVEKAIQVKEKNTTDSYYLDNPGLKKVDSKAGNSVPTSIGPWPLQTLENMPFKQADSP